MKRYALLLLAGLSGCAGTRTIAIDSEPPARIMDRTEVACAKTPCRWTFSRETCWLIDSSTGHFALVAVLDDGRRLRSPMLKTCAVKPGTKLSFQFPAPNGAGDCLVTVSEGAKDSRFPGCEGMPPARETGGKSPR